MVDTRPTDRTRGEGVRPESPGERPIYVPPAGSSTAAPPRSRQRIPTISQLAALVVNGMLMLPRNYRRGMFLDILV
jgi:hypothetical protein